MYPGTEISLSLQTYKGQKGFSGTLSSLDKLQHTEDLVFSTEDGKVQSSFVVPKEK
ncbi:MAG: hypothetical protein H6765_03840 [Candidatus Peribacteria bacterium]|nr:MAG: hypothetical protein H6765_03840 [Candidatus Peribacteria bacterium]